MVYVDTDADRLDISDALQRVTAQRREQALRYKHDSDRRQSLAAYLLLVRALREEYNIRDLPLFGYEQGGKPFIVGHEQIFFNLSHCRGVAACAVSDRPIGVDVETVRPYRDGVARYVLNDEEYSAVTSSQRRDAAFITLWTKKESLLKLTGTGLRDNLKTLLPRADVVFHTSVHNTYIYSVCQYADQRP